MMDSSKRPTESHDDRLELRLLSPKKQATESEGAVGEIRDPDSM